MRFLFALIVRLALFDYWYKSGSLNYSIQQNQFDPGANLRLFDNEIEFYRKLIHTSKKKGFKGISLTLNVFQGVGNILPSNFAAWFLSHWQTSCTQCPV